MASKALHEQPQEFSIPGSTFKHVKLRSGKEYNLAFIPTVGSEKNSPRQLASLV